MGGDTGHGGRTFFRIKNVSSTDMRLAFRDNGKYFNSRYLNDMELTFGGDCELDTFCEALRIGYNVLSQHSTGALIDDFMPSPLEQRQERFALYINELCEHYRKRGSLKGMGDIRNKHHITGLTQQQFFECDFIMPRATCRVSSVIASMPSFSTPRRLSPHQSMMTYEKANLFVGRHVRRGAGCLCAAVRGGGEDTAAARVRVHQPV